MPAAHLPPDSFRSRHRAAGHPGAPLDPPAAWAARDRAAGELAALNRATARLGRGFAVANAAGFAVMVLLACTGGGLLGTEVFGRVNLGIVLGVAQAVGLLWTAARFDRRSTRTCDPLAETLGEGLHHSQYGDPREDRYGANPREERYGAAPRYQDPWDQRPVTGR